MTSGHLALFLLTAAAGACAQQQIQCTSDIDSCSCNLAGGGKIDLHPLDGGASPRFSNVFDTTHFDSWAWNPCTDFTYGNCFQASVCQTRDGGDYIAGYQNSAVFETDPVDGLRIKYIANTDAYRTSYVQLLCDPNDEGTLTALGEKTDGDAEYFLTLSSKYACPSGGGNTNPPPIGPTKKSGNKGNGLTPGSIMLIILIVCLAVYITSGILVQRFARQKQGKEMIPNLVFWTTLPGLVKDGGIYTFRRIRSLGGRKASYEDI